MRTRGVWVVVAGAAAALAACSSADPAPVTAQPTSTVVPSTAAPSTSTAPTTAAPIGVRILPVGDSITDGPENFRRQLMDRLEGDHCRYDMVGSRQDAAEDRRAGRDPDHEGHAGWQANMLADEAREWAQATQPDLVTVAAGVNDFYQTSDTPQQAAEDVLRLLRELRAGAPGAALLVGQIHPGGGIEAEVAELNRLLAERAQRETPGPLTLVDLASGFNVDAYTVDGVHPNAAGAVVLAERWYRALRPLLPCG